MKTMGQTMLASILLAATPAFADPLEQEVDRDLNLAPDSGEDLNQDKDWNCKCQYEPSSEEPPVQEQHYPPPASRAEPPPQNQNQNQNQNQGHYSAQFDPWNPNTTAIPPARPGYAWVPGQSDWSGHWIPGYYRPIQTRPGYLWEPGYWHGGAYVDGFWRPVERSGWVWVPGHYGPHGKWLAGRWARG